MDRKVVGQNGVPPELGGFLGRVVQRYLVSTPEGVLCGFRFFS